MNIEAELILKVGRKELRLSPDEARELREALCDLVGPRYSPPSYPHYLPYTTTGANCEVNSAGGTVSTNDTVAYSAH